LDYGFATADRETTIKLLGLYIGLLDPHRLGVKPYTLHKWRVRGTLVENIKKEFEKIPEASRGGYYPWFLQNQDVISGKLTPEQREKKLEMEVEESIRRAWGFIGRPSVSSMEEIDRWRRSASHKVNGCFILYTMLLSGTRPGPTLAELWISFGFCACTSQEAESDLTFRYQALIEKTTFDDFCAAYASSSLPSLFNKHGLAITDPYVLDLLSSPHFRKSVWDLKTYVEIKTINSPEDTAVQPENSVRVDYGFINCKTAEDHKMLFDVYKGFFLLQESANPIELHNACIEGRLFTYFAKDLGFKLRPTKTYQRLLKNFYPLPDV
jgi:hypothetical protein